MSILPRGKVVFGFLGFGRLFIDSPAFFKIFVKAWAIKRPSHKRLKWSAEL